MDYDSKILSLHLLRILRAFSRCSCRRRRRFLRNRLESLRGCTKEQEDKEAIRCGQQFHIPLKSLSKRPRTIRMKVGGGFMKPSVKCSSRECRKVSRHANESNVTCDFNGNFALCPPAN